MGGRFGRYCDRRGVHRLELRCKSPRDSSFRWNVSQRKREYILHRSARGGPTMPGDEAIKHVVLLMMENHAFDQMLGCFQEKYPELDGVDMNSASPRFNLDLSGNKVYQIPTDEQQMERDPKHENRFALDQIANGNSGFVADYQKNVKGNTVQDRQYVMGYYLMGRLPALHSLADNFTVCDHWFSSLPGPTWPNRFFALSGTSRGHVSMPEGVFHPDLAGFFDQHQDTLFDRLNEAGRAWKVYFYDVASSWILVHQRAHRNLDRYEVIDFFFDDAARGTLPEFVFIEPKYYGQDQNDDHPPHNVMKAEKLIADVYNALRTSPQWEETLLVVAYDEHGGFYDHVPPPAAVAPDEFTEE